MRPAVKRQEGMIMRRDQRDGKLLTKSTPATQFNRTRTSQYRISSKAENVVNLTKVEPQKRRLNIRMPKLPDPSLLYQDIDAKDIAKHEASRDRAEVLKIAKWESEKIMLESILI